MSLSQPILSASSEHSEPTPGYDVPDSTVCDPVKELDHQALAVLLDHAMSYLPGDARQVLEAHYLAAMPQREIALQWGLTISALESRLHRARHQLRQVLSHDLRTEAEDFGLVLGWEAVVGWRQTREWCNLCGRRRLLGIFEPCAKGLVNFRLRCPDCSRRLDLDNVSSNGIVALEGFRSFRPALKRTMQAMTSDFMHAVQTGQRTCSCCRGPSLVRILSPDAGLLSLPHKFWLGLDCPTCGLCLRTLDTIVCWLHPAMQRFMGEHPRWISEPDTVVEYAGSPAIRFHFSDLTGTAHLTLLAHRETLQILATFQE